MKCYFKGTVHPKFISFLLPVVLFISLDSFGFGDIGRRDFCLLSNIMGLNGALNVVLTAPKIHLRNSTVMSLSRNTVIQNDPQTLLGAVLCSLESRFVK